MHAGEPVGQSIEKKVGRVECTVQEVSSSLSTCGETFCSCKLAPADLIVRDALRVVGGTPIFTEELLSDAGHAFVELRFSNSAGDGRGRRHLARRNEAGDRKGEFRAGALRYDGVDKGELDCKVAARICICLALREETEGVTLEWCGGGRKANCIHKGEGGVV